MEPFIALAVIGLAGYFLIRGEDVRLVLFVAGLTLAILAGKPWVVLDIFKDEMGKGETIGPICSAMGYAYILRATGCDREMVRMLLAPLRRIRWLLVPGGCVVGFLTNIAVTSQTASAAAVGSVLIPLMLAAGFPPLIAAATLVLGCSGGGSLFNPGDADLIAIQKNSGQAMNLALDAMFLPLVLGFGGAILAFAWKNRGAASSTADAGGASQPSETTPVNYLKAVLPPLPVIMIFVSLPNFNLFPPLLELYDKGLPVSHAMLICTMIVLLIYRKDLSAQTKIFFEGMGYAYIHIISLIITATCFIEGMRTQGLIDRLVGIVTNTGFFGRLCSMFFPGILAVVCGSGIAPSVAFAKAVLPSLSGPEALDLGVLAAIGSTFGRTMSPVAAVVIFTATLVKVSSTEIVKRTAPPLAVGAVIVFAVISLR